MRLVLTRLCLYTHRFGPKDGVLLLHRRRLDRLIAIAVSASVALVLGTSPAAATPAPPIVSGPSLSIPLAVGSVQRTFNLYLPPHLSATTPATLIVALSPYAHTSTDFEHLTRLDALADKQHLVVAYPDSMFGRWNADKCCEVPDAPHPDDVAFIDALISKVEQIVTIDPLRVDLVGFSNGAMMAQRYACEHSDRVAAVVSVAGALETTCNATYPVSLLEIHALPDATVPFLGLAYSRVLFSSLTPVPTSIGVWERLDRCSGLPIHSSAADLNLRQYPSCVGGSSVQLTTITHGFHDWPTAAEQGIDATAVAWDFLSSHPHANTPFGKSTSTLAIHAVKSGGQIAGSLDGRFDQIAKRQVSVYWRSGTVWDRTTDVVTDVQGNFTAPIPTGAAEMRLGSQLSGALPVSLRVSL